MTGPLRAVVGILIVSAAAAAGFAVNRFLLGDLPPTITEAPALPVSIPEEATEQRPPRIIPEVMPDFTLPDLQNKPRKLSSWKDRPLIVNFWATWCEPCRREIPLLKKLREDHKAEGLEIVGVAVDQRDAVLKYAREIGISYPVLIGEQEALDAIEAFGMEAVFPFSVFGDRRGRIVAVKVGELHDNEAAAILARIKEVDAGRLALPQAREQIAEQLRVFAIERAHDDAASHEEDRHE